MEPKPRTRSFCFLALTTFVVLGSMLNPAAGLASAAGLLHGPFARLDRSADADLARSGDDEAFHVFLPLIMRRWPPIAYPAELAVAEDVVWDAPVSLSWKAEVPVSEYPIQHYVLEESTSPDFLDVTSYTVPSTTLAYTVTKDPGEMGELYFRVRGHNAWGAGEWSSPVTAQLLSVRDRFDYPATGWTLRRTSYHLLERMPSWYEDGYYNTVVGDKYDFAIFSPMQPAPEVPYVIKMRTRVVHKANETSFGIVFGGNGGTLCGVALPQATDPDGCFYHYYRLNVIWGGYLKYGLTRIDAHEGKDGKGVSGSYGGYSALQWYEGNADGWNDWEIRVYDTGYKVYVNGYLLRDIPDPKYVHEPYYGIFGSNYEYNGGHFRHDYFIVEPLEVAP